MILSNEMRVECSSKEAADFLCPCQRIADIARSQANLWPGWLMSSGGGAGYEGQTKFTVYRHKIFHFACGRAVIIQIHISPTATFSMARDKKLTRLCSPAFGDLRRS